MIALDNRSLSTGVRGVPERGGKSTETFAEKVIILYIIYHIGIVSRALDAHCIQVYLGR